MTYKEADSSLVSLQATARGKVQGVFFRDFIRRYATELGVAGYIRNLDDGRTVELHAEGEHEKLEQLLKLFTQGPPGAEVKEIEASWGKPTSRYHGFRIIR